MRKLEFYSNIQIKMIDPEKRKHFFRLLYLHLNRWERKKKERERNINVWFLLACSLPRT